MATSCVIDLRMHQWFELSRHHIYKDILRPPLERHSRAEKNPTISKIALLWLLKKMILNDSYYRWTCASNHFSTMWFVLKKGGTISYDVVTGPRHYSRNLEKLLHDQQCSYISANLHPILVKAPSEYSEPSLMVPITCWTSLLTALHENITRIIELPV